ncbi:MAG: hypothetical protein WBF04_22355 [Candidatus Sulfotelmatobacter sp.]
MTFLTPLHHFHFDAENVSSQAVNCDQFSEAGSFILNAQQGLLDLAKFATNRTRKPGCVEVSMNMNLMDPKLIALAAAVIVLVALAAWLYVRKRRGTTAGLRQKFGPEYDRAVLTHGSKAEAKLADREKRIEKLNIRDLDPAEHERFSKHWQAVQSRFVDSPKGAVTEADDLVSAVMKARGYPVYPISINVPPIFLSTILAWWKTTARRMELRCAWGKTQPLPKI